MLDIWHYLIKCVCQRLLSEDSFMNPEDILRLLYFVLWTGEPVMDDVIVTLNSVGLLSL